jgi:hypothetical protein
MSPRFLEDLMRAKKIFDREEKNDRARRFLDEFARRRKNLGSRMLASRANLRDRMIGAKFRSRAARSIDREISFTIRALPDKFFSALVLIAK